MRVEVDRQLCEANALCVLQAPDVFTITVTDELDILRPVIAPGEGDAIARAVRACPKHALRITED